MIDTSHRTGIGMTSQRTRDRLVERLMEQGIRNPFILDLIRNTPRHLFVDEALATRAYEDTALPIGHGQTISQPYIVARMTEALLHGERPARVLEVGTGCGYQTAVLAQCCDKVFSVERIEALQERARQTLRGLNMRNVRLGLADGGWGWEQHAPFDAIMVTCAAPEIPAALVEQLNEGGRLVIPVGGPGIQELVLGIKRGGRLETQVLNDVSFVPLKSGVVR